MSVQAHDAWSGELFTVDNAGVTNTGGLSLTSDGDRTRIQAVARMLVVTDTEDKPGADAAIIAATATIAVTTKYTTTTTFTDPKVTSVFCGQAMTPAGDPAGCDSLDILLPTGNDAQPLSITARSGNGKVNVNLGDAIRALDLHGSHGPIDVTIPATPKAVVSIVADTGDEITLRLPRDFAADLISLETTGFIDTTAFPDVQSGKPRGAAGTGAKSITLRAGAGRITLLAR